MIFFYFHKVLFLNGEYFLKWYHFYGDVIFFWILYFICNFFTLFFGLCPFTFGLHIKSSLNCTDASWAPHLVSPPAGSLGLSMGSRKNSESPKTQKHSHLATWSNTRPFPSLQQVVVVTKQNLTIEHCINCYGNQV